MSRLFSFPTVGGDHWYRRRRYGYGYGDGYGYGGWYDRPWRRRRWYRSYRSYNDYCDNYDEDC